MMHQSWSMAFRLIALSGFALSCGTEGSLPGSGSNDWSFDGSMLPGGGNQTPREPGNSSGGSVATGGSAPLAGVGGNAATDGKGGVGVAGSGVVNTAGTANGSRYHQLANWTEPQANNPNHHGRAYFLGNAHRDENGAECSSCHGKNYEGDAGPACATCHQEWRSSCTYCHGTQGVLGGAPPRGVWDETSTASLAVGRHSAHLTAGDSHVGFNCTGCHTVPAANDVDHTLGYKASIDLAVPGHHGDVQLSGSLPGMSWDLNATTGTPASARGTCVGGCHSDGRGGTPRKTPYWAGGSWSTGCGNCHDSRPNTGHHDHALDEGGACGSCHAGSSGNKYATDAHFDGKVEYLGTISGQGMTLKADPSCASGVRCNGTCHGNNEGHNNRCW